MSALLALHLAPIRERVPDSTPHGAYCLGLLAALTMKTCAAVPENILDEAMKVSSIAEAYAITDRHALSLRSRFTR